VRISIVIWCGSDSDAAATSASFLACGQAGQSDTKSMSLFLAKPQKPHLVRPHTSHTFNKASCPANTPPIAETSSRSSPQLPRQPHFAVIPDTPHLRLRVGPQPCRHAKLLFSDTIHSCSPEERPSPSALHTAPTAYDLASNHGYDAQMLHAVAAHRKFGDNSAPVPTPIRAES
jgi:hypothetical protein